MLKQKRSVVKNMQLKNLVFVIRYDPDRYKTQKMCDNITLKNDERLKIVPDCLTKLLCLIMLIQLNLSLIGLQVKKCAIKLSILILLQYNLFLNTISLNKCVITCDVKKCN